jgi:hypothetical protein
VHLAVEPRPRLAADLGDVREVGLRPSLAGALLDAVEQERERLVDELHRLEERVDVPRLVRLPRVEHAVLAERVLDDEPDRLLGADQPRDELRPAPSRNEAEKDLGAGEVAHGCRDRAVVAVQCDLDAATERGAVDRRDRDEREIAQAPEQLVTRLPAEPCALGRDLAELAEVGTDGEDERLARQQQSAPVPRPELVEDFLERAKRRLPERVRLLPVLAVVHRHERDRPRRRLDPLELELRRRASHARRSPGSPRRSRRPCRARCTAPSARSAPRGGPGTRARAAP